VPCGPESGHECAEALRLMRCRARKPLPCCNKVGVHRKFKTFGCNRNAAKQSLKNRFEWLNIARNPYMKFLSYAYRFLSNFVFLALVYYSLNFLEKYQQRAIVAILVLVLFLSAHRTARVRGAAPHWRDRGWSCGIGCAQANHRRRSGFAPCRRNEVLYRPAVSDPGRASLHFEDRDGLSRRAFLARTRSPMSVETPVSAEISLGGHRFLPGALVPRDVRMAQAPG
jgi:hypothetical protein